MLFTIRIYISKILKTLKPIRGVKNHYENDGKGYKFKLDVIGNNNKITIGSSIVMNSTIYIRGNNNTLTIENQCHINNTNFRIEDDNGVLSIGNKTSIEGANFIIAENNKNIIIGEDCMFSSGIQIEASDSHTIFDIDSNERINFGEDIIIGNHVWLGRFVTILKGVTINDNCIIGTKSLVTKSTDTNGLYVGIPAKKIKDNVNWNRTRN
ncbi:acyltransferase [Flavobacterium sp.]|uniref:acyltransferase n=1 Tax=Flavobacterium sp. TaxID=239 RepID=UPI0025D86B67|nr:acyltransferase [Flavobacterium sp.]